LFDGFQTTIGAKSSLEAIEKVKKLEHYFESLAKLPSTSKVAHIFFHYLHSPTLKA
jgi:hypothetical protein